MSSYATTMVDRYSHVGAAGGRAHLAARHDFLLDNRGHELGFADATQLDEVDAPWAAARLLRILEDEESLSSGERPSGLMHGAITADAAWRSGTKS